MAGPRTLDACLSIADLRSLARRRLPAPVYPHLVGAAEDEATLRRNTEALDAAGLVPRCLVDVAGVDTRTTLFGQAVEWPVYCSPTGASRLFHPEGELAVARAAAEAGILYGLSTVATHSLEDVAAVAGGPKLYQIYLFKDRGLTFELVDRAKAAGYRALCLTVDAPERGKCEREARHGLSQRFAPAAMLSFALHPGWSLGQMRRGPLAIPSVARASGGRGFAVHSAFVGAQLDASVTWKDAEALAARWNGPFAVKGVMAADDARRAADHGATAVVVSNHGGRQLDGAAATFEVLPAIASAVGDRLEVILDGGIRRGSHVLKALARGAKACSIGRPYLYGLAAGGKAGVARALAILRQELVLAMRFAGCPDIASIDERLLLAREI